MDKKLFGGALQARLPKDVIDVSGFRQVPDNQEVFLIERGQTDKSVIIEVLEQPHGDIQQAMQLHVSDLLELDEVRPLEIRQLANGVSENYITTYSDKLTTIVALMRLNKVHTDILVSINVPVGDVTSDVQVVEDIVASFKVNDWGLFGEA